jgi:predicted AAA+ superfamily ATPase
MVRRDITRTAKKFVNYYGVTAIIGPRQSGKTTLVRSVFDDFTYKNLEEPDTFQFAESDPRGFLNYSGKGIIIDEAQKLPMLFSYIQAIVDSDPKAKFILTGSQNFLLFE